MGRLGWLLGPWVLLLLLFIIFSNSKRASLPDPRSQGQRLVVDSEPLVKPTIEVDLLIVIYTQAEAKSLQSFYDFRFTLFPLVDPANPHIRIWIPQRDPARNLTFAYFWISANASLSQPNFDNPPHLNLQSRVITVQSPADYRSLIYRTAAMLTDRSKIFPSWFPEPRFDLLLRIDDDSFPCFERLFHGVNERVVFSRHLKNGVSAEDKIDARKVWGGQFVNGLVGRDPSHKWYDGQYLEELEWQEGKERPWYPGVYVAGFFWLGGSSFIGKLESRRADLRLYGLEDATVSIWVYRTVKLEEHRDYERLWINLVEGYGCKCAGSPKEVNISRDTWVWHGCKTIEEHAACLSNAGVFC